MSNSHSQISFSQWREFYGNTKKSLSSEVREISDYIRAYISDVLSSPEKGAFTREDFTRMKKYTENLVPYMEVLREFGKDSPTLLQRLLTLYQPHDLDDFLDALKADEFVFKVLKNTPEKNLEHIIGLCTSRNEWEDLCKDVDVRYILGVAEENFLYAVSMYDLNRVENFRRFIQDYHKVSILLSTISAENLRYIVSLYGATNRDQLDQLCKYLDVGEFGDTPVYSLLSVANPKNLRGVVKLYNIHTLEQFGSFCNRTPADIAKYERGSHMRTPDYIRKGEVHFFLRHATENNFEAVLRICSNPSDLEDICNTMGIAPIMLGDQFTGIIGFCRTAQELIKFVRLSQGGVHISELCADIIKKIAHSYEDILFLFKHPYISSGPGSISSGSEILREVLPVYMEQKNIYAFLRKRASAFLRTVPQPTLNISPSERPALAIYFRLGNHIDYPEVGDAIIIFMQEYLKYFRDASFFSSIRIIPRDADKRPNNSVLKDKNTQFYEVYGAEFLHALHNGAIPIYLSHSCYSGKKGHIKIISHNMDGVQQSDITLPFDLETSHHGRQGNIVQELTIDTLFSELVLVIGKVHQKLQGHTKENPLFPEKLVT